MPTRNRSRTPTAVDQMPEEVRVINQWLDQRMTGIQARDKVTPWNKAKLIAFQEVKDLITPSNGNGSEAPVVEQTVEPVTE